jgi:hypothetical protein
MALKALDTSVATLTGYIDTIMTSIFTSVDNCPNMLRQALRQLWVRVAEKYKDPEYMVSQSECRSVVFRVLTVLNFFRDWGGGGGSTGISLPKYMQGWVAIGRGNP